MPSVNRFYQLSETRQNWWQAKILFSAFTFNALVGLLFWLITPSFSLLLICCTLAITLSVIAPFIDVPSGVKSGGLTYYSAYLIAESPKQNIISIHGGTLFDYFFSILPASDSKARKKQVLLGYIEGLLSLLQRYEDENIDYQLRATSYIINEKTAKSIGFYKKPTDQLSRAILYYNYFNLACSYSLIQGRPSILKIKEVQTFESSFKDLFQHKNKLLKLKNKLMQ